MSDFTKWEQNSVKTNIVLPLVFVAIAAVLVIVMFVIKPKPPEIAKKKDKEATTEVETAVSQEDIDWENF